MAIGIRYVENNKWKEIGALRMSINGEISGPMATSMQKIRHDSRAISFVIGMIKQLDRIDTLIY
ncbi:hypothetical protein F506_16205 [Herbaspirillum hiltneri N3]|uniref:Uncharacterized protein n=1 Tax=Herbaspirillum hiltneri N3 TaxID=1262470 RepID=A0ABN4HYU9_9BURK|nr:hypothetical protein F506_16205 [Herbaspirillum hiltneri N3]